MLVQTDGTPFDWFNIGQKYSLHGYVDDATGKILGLYMCENKCLMGYLEITRQMLKKYDSPVAIYSDKYSVFFFLNLHKKLQLKNNWKEKKNQLLNFIEL